MFCPVMEKLPGSFLVGVAVVPAIWFSFAGFFCVCGEMLKGRHGTGKVSCQFSCIPFLFYGKIIVM